jgi:hypothetical protein
LIPVLLILLRPSPGLSNHRPVSRWVKALPWLWWSVLVLSTWLDYQAARPVPVPAALFPAQHAAIAYSDDRLEDAWLQQRRALHFDPYGPETLFNTGLIASRLGSQTGDPAYGALALKIWNVNFAMHPFYAPAREKWGEHAESELETLSDPYIAHQELLDRLEDFPRTDAGDL